MALDLNKINCAEFCNVQGVDQLSRSAIIKYGRGQLKSYDDWLDALSKGFNLGSKRDFSNKSTKPEIAEPEVQTTIKDSKIKNK